MRGCYATRATTPSVPDAVVLEDPRAVNLILVEASEVSATGVAWVGGARAAHLRNVLKVAIGHQVRIGMIDGMQGIGTVTHDDGGAIALQCVLEVELPRPRVDLLLAMPRPKVLRRLWAQLAALGVGRIILTNASRVERNYFDTHVLTPECYRPLLVEGLQQARDTHLPRVSVHRQFRVLVEDELDALAPHTARLVADPSGEAAVDAALAGCETRVLLALGPEGGWNAFELELLDAHGFRRVGLGPRTLRSDTACIALLSLVHDALGRAAARQGAAR